MGYSIQGNFALISSLWIPKGTCETFLDVCTEEGESYDNILTNLIREYLDKKNK